MYLRLMLRGILRHRKKGKRLFVLIALSAAAMIFLFTFQSSFTVQYRDIQIGAITGHLKILASDAPALKEGAASFVISETMPLISIDQTTQGFVRSLDEVAVSGGIIDTYAGSFNLDGEQESGFHLVGVDANLRRSLYPTNVLLEGSDDIAWDPSMEEVPVLSPRMQTEYGQENGEYSSFQIKELRVSGPNFEDFKQILIADFPALFTHGDYSGSGHDKDFFDDWNAALKRNDLPAIMRTTDGYDWRLDDAIVALRENRDPQMLAFLNKRFFKALYDAYIGPVREPILIGKSISVQMSGAKSTDGVMLPVVIPARYIGFAEVLPLYGDGASAFMEVAALQDALSLEQNDYTAYMVRLKDIRDVGTIKRKIEAHLRERGLSYAVADFSRLDKFSKPISTAISVLCTVLSAVLSIIVAILVVNMVMLSVLARRREIGTSIALGLSTYQNIAIMLGEVCAIVAVSWIMGCIGGAILVWLGAAVGIPGMVFFPGGKLYMTFGLAPFIGALLILAPASFLAALLPLLPLRLRLPVDMLKEER